LEDDLTTGLEIDVSSHLVDERDPGGTCGGESEVCRAIIRIIRVGVELYEGAVLGAWLERKRGASRVDGERSVDGYVAERRRVAAVVDLMPRLPRSVVELPDVRRVRGKCKVLLIDHHVGRIHAQHSSYGHRIVGSGFGIGDVVLVPNAGGCVCVQVSAGGDLPSMCEHTFEQLRIDLILLAEQA